MSGYLEVFILIGVALGGTGLVFGAATQLLGSASGSSVAIVSASIRQGAHSAVESIAVADTGTRPLGDLTITTSEAPAPSRYCFSAEDLARGVLLSSTCPAAAGDPGRVEVQADVGPGGSVLVELVITGGAFTLGSEHLIAVTASGGAQSGAYVQVVPA